MPRRVLDREGLVAADGQPFVSDIVSETDRMGRLVGDMLALASAEAGAVSVERHPVELVAWLTDLARRAESMAGTHGLTIRTDLPSAASVVVEADEDRLTQVLLILVDNAIEHSPSGGIITLGLALQGGRVSVSVSDQVRASRPRTVIGSSSRSRDCRERGAAPPESGLGLAIARQLVSRHDGELAVDDAPGGGARFVLRLPPGHPVSSAAPRPTGRYLARSTPDSPDSSCPSSARIAASSAGSAWSQPHTWSAP